MKPPPCPQCQKRGTVTVTAEKGELSGDVIGYLYVCRECGMERREVVNS